MGSGRGDGRARGRGGGRTRGSRVRDGRVRDGAEQAVRRLHAADTDRDRDALLACPRDDVVWRAKAAHPMAGAYRARASLREQYPEPLWPAPARGCAEPPP